MFDGVVQLHAAPSLPGSKVNAWIMEVESCVLTKTATIVLVKEAIASVTEEANAATFPAAPRALRQEVFATPMGEASAAT